MHQEAVEDGIRMVKTSSGDTLYYPKCHICGEEILSLNYLRDKEYTCKACKLQQYLSDKENREILSYEAKEKKYFDAIKRIEKVTSLKPYNHAMDAIKKNLHRDGWFQSTEEILVGLELVRRNIKTRHQVKMGRYCVDFMLTDEKVVLEIDGTPYHTLEKRKKENLRDGLILAALGPEWEIVRIPDTLVNQNITKLVKAIRKIKQNRTLMRSQHDGILPDWYTDRIA